MKALTIGLTVSTCLSSLDVYAQGFFEDSKVSVQTRNFYYSQDIRSTHTPGQAQWGQGFLINARSGYTASTVGFGIDALLLSGFRLDDGGHIGKAQARRVPAAGGLFPIEDGRSVDEFSSLGLTAKARYGKSVMQYGTFQPLLPVVWRNDGRLLPQTYNGWQFQSKDVEQVTLTLGRLDHSKGRASTDQQGLSIAGANSNRHAFVNQFYYGGVDYSPTKALLLRYYFGNLEDFYWQNFYGAQYKHPLSFGQLGIDLRYFDSRSSGKNASLEGRADGYRSSGNWSAGDPHRGEVDNQTWSIETSLKIKSNKWGVAYQQMNGSSQYVYLDQGNGSTTYLITQRLVDPFNYSGSKTWQAYYNYQFSAIGVPGLSAQVTYTQARNIRNGDRLLGQQETDLEVFYQVQKAPLKGLFLGWRHGQMKSDVRPDTTQDRLFITYNFDL